MSRQKPGRPMEVRGPGRPTGIHGDRDGPTRTVGGGIGRGFGLYDIKIKVERRAKRRVRGKCFALPRGALP